MENFKLYAYDAKDITSLPNKTRGNTYSLTDTFGPRFTKRFVGDAKAHDANFAFLTTTLAKLDPTLHKPLFWVTYQLDVPVEVGSGFVDYIEYYTIDWAGITSEYRNYIGNSTNYIPRVNAGMSQERMPVFTYGVAYDLRFVDLEKMKKLKLQESIQKIYLDVVMAGWDMFCQHMAYVGLVNGVGVGLFNSTKVHTATIDNSAATGPGFTGLSDSDVVAFFNGIIEYYLTNSHMNLNILPDTFLVPVFVSKDLSQRYSELYVETLRSFLMKHNLATDESNGQIKSINIQGRPELNDLGAAGKGRIVAYRKDPSFLKLHVPYPIQMYITLPNIERMAYTTAFVGQVSGVEMPYDQNSAELGIISYWDFTK